MKTEIKWGLIFVAVLLLWMVLERAAGLHDKNIAYHAILSMLFIIPAVTMVYLAIREKRRVLGGRITFTQAFLCGLGVSVIVALLAPLTQYIIARFISPNFFDNMIAFTVSQGKMTLDQARQFFNLRSYVVQGSMGALGMGAATSLILAGVMRSRGEGGATDTAAQI